MITIKYVCPFKSSILNCYCIRCIVFTFRFNVVPLHLFLYGGVTLPVRAGLRDVTLPLLVGAPLYQSLYRDVTIPICVALPFHLSFYSDVTLPDRYPVYM